MTEFELVIKNEPLISPDHAESLGLFGLIKLVMDGYGFSGDETEKLAQFHQEYGKAGKTMFFIKNTELVVASLVLRPIDNILGYKVVNLSGIVVSPKYRGIGLVSKLLESAVIELTPDLFV
ncbi:MAG: GNAT family N-acetyltransferase, partial [Candidatus Woesebacteria bacterium]|nr:GNAT family N-acetyltransferase [Candidatus Woesebacteria bacterium]